MGPSPRATAAEQRNRWAVRRAYELGLNQRDLAIVDEVFDAGCTAYFRGGPPIRGRAALVESLSALLAAFSDLAVSVEDTIAEGDRVAVRWSAAAVHTGDFRGLPPSMRVPATGLRVSFTAIDLCRLEGGLIVEHWSTLDQLDLLHQMGVAQVLSGRA